MRLAPGASLSGLVAMYKAIDMYTHVPLQDADGASIFQRISAVIRYNIILRIQGYVVQLLRAGADVLGQTTLLVGRISCGDT